MRHSQKANIRQHSSCMETPDNKYVSPKEMELIDKIETPAKTKHEQQEKLDVEELVVQITFCTHVGWDGILVMVLSLGIASATNVIGLPLF